MAIADSYIIYYCPDADCDFWDIEPGRCYLEHKEDVPLDLVELEVFPDGEVRDAARENEDAFYVPGSPKARSTEALFQNLAAHQHKANVSEFLADVNRQYRGLYRKTECLACMAPTLKGEEYCDRCSSTH